MEGTILFLGAAEEAAASGDVLEMAGEVLLCPGETFLLSGEGFFVRVASARPGPVAAAREGVVFVVRDETVVGGILPVMRPLMSPDVGDNGGQEVARLPDVDARVVLVAVVVNVVAGDDSLISDPLLSKPPDLLDLGSIVLIRVGASRPSTQGVRELTRAACSPGGSHSTWWNCFQGFLPRCPFESAGSVGTWRRATAPPTPVSSSCLYSWRTLSISPSS